jgi:polar amino acid transport system substrate-binding protein
VIESYKLGIAMRQNEPELKGWVDEWIKTNLQNGKLNEIHLKYAGVPIPDEIVQGAGQ